MSEHIKTAAVVKALNEAAGNVTLAAKKLRCHRDTIYKAAKRSRDVQRAIEAAREELVDHAESALRKAVMKAEGWAVCFALKCLAKDRGYVERQEIKHEGGIQLEIVEELTDARGPTPDQDAPGAASLPPE